MTNRRSLEVAGGDGYESNTANLAMMHGWESVLFDGLEENHRKAEWFFGQEGHSGRMVHRPKHVRAFVTAETVNELVRAAGMEGEIDLFSLDMDGMDWWVWKNLTVVDPRVVVVETQELWLWETAKTHAYDAAFVADGIPSMGASIAAFVVLARHRGFRLIGCISIGFNAFFMRHDVGVDEFPEYDPKGCFAHADAKFMAELTQRRNEARRFDWVDVDDSLFE